MTGTPLELIAVEVRADLDRLESGMSNAVRVVDQSMGQIDRSVGSAERSISVASQNVERSLGGGSNAARVFGQQIGQMGQQVIAGTSVLQALAIQLPDLAAGMSSAGGSAGRFAAILGGPWGLAVTTAISLAVAFIPKILGIGDAADQTKPSIDRLAGAYTDLAAAMGRADAAGLQAQAVATIRLQKDRADLAKATDALTAAETKLAASKRVDPKGQGSAPLIRDVEEAKANLAAMQQQVKTAENFVQLGEDRLKRAQALAKAGAADSAPVTRTSGRAVAPRTRAPNGLSEADQLAKEKEQLDKRYDTTLEQFQLEQKLADLRAQGTLEAQAQADKMEVVAQIERQFPELANSTNEIDKQRLAVLEQIATATIDAAYARKADKDAAAEQMKRDKEIADQRKQTADDLARRQERQVQDLASIYEDAFHGGTKAIWSDFKTLGLRAIAETLARFTIGELSGGGGIGGLISGIGSFLGFASGGSGTIGGRGGTDTNVLSLNGRPFANVSRGETLAIGSKALKGGSGATVVQPIIQVDARGAVMNDQFAQMILAKANQGAVQAATSMGKAINANLPNRLATFQRDGT